MTHSISILSIGRSHLFDLALGLARTETDVTFYSVVPQFRLKKYCRHDDKIRLVSPPLWISALYLCLGRLRIKSEVIQFIIGSICDLHCLSTLSNKPHTVISMSGMFLKTISEFKKNGSVVVVDRGSLHEVDMWRFTNRPKLYIRSNYLIRRLAYLSFQRELSSYKIADIIMVPTELARESFLQRGYSPRLVYVASYPISSMFFEKHYGSPIYDFIYVGNWSYSKGVDRLIEIMKKLKTKSLIHVGKITDNSLSASNMRIKNIHHLGPVPNFRIPKLMKLAKYYMLASRAEGLSLSIGQALASGLMCFYSQDLDMDGWAKYLTNDNALVPLDFDLPIEVVVSKIEGRLSKSSHYPSDMQTHRPLINQFLCSPEAYAESIKKILVEHD